MDIAKDRPWGLPFVKLGVVRGTTSPRSMLDRIYTFASTQIGRHILVTTLRDTQDYFEAFEIGALHSFQVLTTLLQGSPPNALATASLRKLVLPDLLAEFVASFETLHERKLTPWFTQSGDNVLSVNCEDVCVLMGSKPTAKMAHTLFQFKNISLNLPKGKLVGEELESEIRKYLSLPLQKRPITFRVRVAIKSTQRIPMKHKQTLSKVMEEIYGEKGRLGTPAPDSSVEDVSFGNDTHNFVFEGTPKYDSALTYKPTIQWRLYDVDDVILQKKREKSVNEW